MGRNSVLCNLLAMALLVATPVLCIDGLISHPCECGDEIGCGHETDCSDDPCNVTVIVQNGSSVRAFDLSELVTSPLDNAPLVAVEATRYRFTLRMVEPPGRDNRPYADSDVPLLI
jgi:hypothetical protein